MKLKTLLFSVLCLSLIALAGGCSDDSDGTTPSTDTGSGDTTTVFTWPANTGEVVNTYAEIVKASYADSVATAQTLDGALEALVNAPSEANLTAARDAWFTASSPEAHKRLRVTPGTDCGSPASKRDIRATLRLSSPAWLAHPMNTSSTKAGSSPVRSISVVIAMAARSSARTPERPP